MSDNTTINPGYKDLTSYAQLLLKLNDEQFARQYHYKQLDRAKQLFEQLLGVTDDVMEFVSGDAGHQVWLELIEILSVRHENFSTMDFYEEFQNSIWKMSQANSDAQSVWKKNLLANAGLDEYGIEIEQETKADQPAEPEPVDVSPEVLPQTEKPASEKPVPSTAKNIEEHHFEIWANKLAYVLASEKVSGEIKFALRNIFTDAANEVGVHLDDQNLIKPAFIEFMRQADFGYGKGVSNAIQTIITDLQRMELEGELERFETRFDAPKIEAASEPIKQPLDLSGCAPEDLNVKISELPTMRDLSCALSGLLHNPLLPAKLFEVITGEIDLVVYEKSPENILANLEQMRRGASE